MRTLAGCVVLAGAALWGQQPQQRNGDWVVKGSESVENASIILAGKLIVEDKASLTLSNVTLAFARAPQGYFGIEARSGSTLTMSSCTLKPAVDGARFLVRAEGARFQMRNSRVEGLAADPDSERGGSFLVSGAAGAVLEGNTIRFLESASAVVFRRSHSARIVGNTFERLPALGGGAGLMLQESNDNTVSENRLVLAEATATASFNNRFTDNELLMPAGIFLYSGSAYNLVARNRAYMAPVEGTSCFAFRVVGCPLPNYILDNTATGFRYALLVSYSANTVFAGNKIGGMTDAYTGNLHIYRSQNIRLLNNQITGSRPGILLFASRKCEVRGNRVSGALYGVALAHCHENTIAGNEFAKNQDNLVLLDSSDNTVEGNNFYRLSRQGWSDSAGALRNNYWDDAASKGGPYALPGAGLDPSPASAAWPVPAASVPQYAAGTPLEYPRPASTEIKQDTVWENCDRPLGNGITVAGGARLLIRNCRLTPPSYRDSPWGSSLTVASGGTLEILNSTVGGDGLTQPWSLQQSPGGKLIIRDSKILHASTWASGIVLYGAGATIENSELTGGHYGIRVQSAGGGHRIAGNRITESLQGILFVDAVSENNVVEGNDLSGILMEGISAHTFSRGRLAGNRVVGALVGISAGGESNLIRANVLADNGFGLAVGAPGNTVAGNAFLGNGRFAPFAADRGQAVGPAGTAWSLDGRGNYWSDYRGQDADANGIGDTPYENAPDAYPLMSLPGGACAYALNAAEAWLAGPGGAASVSVTSAGGCAWTAVSRASWIRVAAGAGGTGSGTVTLEAGSNPTAGFRSGVVVIAGQEVRVFQAPSNCTYNVTPNSLTVPAAGGQVRARVTTAAGCPWAVWAENQWLAVPANSACAGSGEGEVVAAAAANTGAARTALLRIGTQTIEVAQGASGPVFQPSAIVNAASLLGEALAPGTLFSVFGTRLGPARPAVAATPERGLGGTRLFFEDQEAHLTYSGWDQVNALVPPGLPLGPTRLRMEWDGLPGAMHPVRIVAASPGIFTLDGSGKGQAVAVNQDGSFNSAKNPAARGSIVTFFATGYGLTDPPMEDGRRPEPPTFPKPVLPAQVLFGGQPAPEDHLLFAGAVYAGVLQLNVRIPESAAAGAALDLILSFDCGEKKCASRPGVTLAVR